MLEARQGVFGCSATTAYGVTSFQYKHRCAPLSEHNGGGKPVRSGTDHDSIVVLLTGSFFYLGHGESTAEEDEHSSQKMKLIPGRNNRRAGVVNKMRCPQGRLNIHPKETRHADTEP